MSAETHTFEFKGKSYTIPAYTQIPMRALRKALDEENQIKQSYIILEETVKDKKVLEILGDMTVSDFVSFVEGWAGEAQVAPGD